MDAVAVDPRILGIEEAVSEIHQACEGAAGPHLTPFFLIVGAGISAPAVPLAQAIIEQCQDVARRYQRGGTAAGPSTLDEYSYWFSRAYPGARQRQEFLRGLIEKKPLSAASLRLAHLLSSGRLTNLVVTTNFDDFIARALRLFAQEPAVCDHPRTVGRIDRDRPDIQIVHVHGSYLFYDCANLRAEVNGRARTDESTSFTMIGLLDSLLWSRSPLVVGYSGWEGDVVMSALERRLRGGHPLGQNIYWFCYRRSDMERLPRWLRESGDIRFVVPPEPAAQGATAPAMRSATESASPEPTLRAVQVFDELKGAFAIGEPPLFTNPVDYFARSLELSLPETEGSGGDPYAFKALIERLRTAARTFEQATAPRGFEATLEKLRHLMRTSNYEQAIRVLAGIIPAQLRKLDDDDRREVTAAARLAGAAVLGKRGGEGTDPNLSTVLVFDSRMDQFLDDAPPGMAWVIGSRVGQHGKDVHIGGKPHGAFTARLVEALVDAASDRDGDGVISLLEATIEASRRMAGEQPAQTPVMGGAAADIALFAARRKGSPPAESGTLHAVLVGVGEHKDHGMGGLRGPVNDIAALAKVLEQKERRLFPRAAVTRLLNARATRPLLARALEAVASKARPQDVVLFHFSGHGGYDESGSASKGGAKRPRKAPVEAAADAASDRVDVPPVAFLVLHDYDNQGGGVMTQWDLLAALRKARARRIAVILDF